MNANRFLWGGILGAAAFLAVFLLMGKSLPLSLLIGAAGFAVPVIAIRPPRKKLATSKNEDTLREITESGDRYLRACRQCIAHTKDPAVRRKADRICMTVKKILDTLQERPENIPNVRRFINYYLPTLVSILTKYERIERGGAVAGSGEKVSAYLDDIGSAMDKLLANLFEDDMLDLSVEMEVMTASCKQDGLLTDETFTLQNGDNDIHLSL